MKCAINIIRDSAKFDLSVVNDGIGRARVTIAGLTDTSGIDHLRLFELQLHRNMCVAYADKIHIDMFQPLLPLLGAVTDIFIHGVTWCGMDQQESVVADHQMSGDGHLSQPGQVFITQHIKMVLPHRGHHFSKSSAGPYRHALGDGMIVVAAHHTAGISTNPFDARQWVSGVVNDIAQEQTRVKFFFDDCECGPVRMNIGKQEYSQGKCCFRNLTGGPEWASFIVAIAIRRCRTGIFREGSGICY